MNKEEIKQQTLRIVETISGAGYFLVIASIIYFIIGSVVGLVHGNMLDWTFCGSAHRLIKVDWCEAEIHTPWAWGNQFFHQLINAAVPWVMMVMGLAILALCLPFMKALGYQPKKRNNQDA